VKEDRDLLVYGVGAEEEVALGTQKLLLRLLVGRDGNGYPKPEYPTGFTR
jgi:hypothetical protein